MGFKEKVLKFADDVSSLEVATMSNQKGTIGQNMAVDGSLDSSNDIFLAIRQGMAQSELVGYSRFEFEGDSINYVNNDPEVANLVDQHNNMVIAAQTSRQEFFDTVLRILGID